MLHLSSVTDRFHWLRVLEQVTFKLCLMLDVINRIILFVIIPAVLSFVCVIVYSK